METIAGLPFAELRMDKDGEREQPGVPLFPPGTDDLIVISHGWKNNDDDANTLYATLIGNMVAAAGGAMAGGARKFAVAGIHWPAFRYTEDLAVLPANLGVPGQGGAAALGDADLHRTELAKLATEFAIALRLAHPTEFAAAAIDAAGGGGAADAFLAGLRAHLTPAPDADVAADHAELLAMTGRDVVDALKARPDLPPAPAAMPSGGGAAGLGGTIAAAGARVLRGGKAAVASLLNQATYYEMKARAGVIGAALAHVVEGQRLDGIRVHLIGHSFGARLVTAATAATTTLRPASLSLLQGAYSHNGLGVDIGPLRIEGGFRRVVADTRVSGPLLVTRSIHDSAVGFFYAVASRITGEIAKEFGVRDLIGGPKDLHGGMGANGALALRDGEACMLTATAAAIPDLTPGIVNNVLADTIIGEHNDVANASVGALVWRAVRGGG